MHVPFLSEPFKVQNEDVGEHLNGNLLCALSSLVATLTLWHLVPCQCFLLGEVREAVVQTKVGGTRPQRQRLQRASVCVCVCVCVNMLSTSDAEN
jgi:hypothetical protein